MGVGEVLEPRRLKTRTWGQCHLYPLRSLGPARPPGVGPEVRWWLGQGPSLAETPPWAHRSPRPHGGNCGLLARTRGGTEAAILRMEPRWQHSSRVGPAGGGTLRDGRPGPARSRCLRLQPLPALSRRWRLGAPGGRKRLRAAGHVPCCWPRVRPAEGARGAGRVIGRAQPTGRGTGSPQPRGDPGNTGGSWGWVVRGPLGALLRGRWPRAPSAFPAPWQGPGSRGGGPGWAGQGGLSLSQGRGDPVSGNAGSLPPTPTHVHGGQASPRGKCEHFVSVGHTRAHTPLAGPPARPQCGEAQSHAGRAHATALTLPCQAPRPSLSPAPPAPQIRAWFCLA